MTLEEKYQLALQALRYYAAKEGDGGEEVAVAALMVLDEPIKGDELVVSELLDWKFKAGLLPLPDTNVRRTVL